MYLSQRRLTHSNCKAKLRYHIAQFHTTCQSFYHISIFIPADEREGFPWCHTAHGVLWANVFHRVIDGLCPLRSSWKNIMGITIHYWITQTGKSLSSDKWLTLHVEPGLVPVLSFSVDGFTVIKSHIFVLYIKQMKHGPRFTDFMISWEVCSINLPPYNMWDGTVQKIQLVCWCDSKAN